MTFEARKRLTLPQDFRTVRLKGRHLGDAYFSLSFIHDQGGHARLGLAIATRIFGSAVARNRIKRLIRESFRLNQRELPPVNITVAARAAARGAEAGALRASLQRHWASITARN